MLNERRLGDPGFLPSTPLCSPEGVPLPWDRASHHSSDARWGCASRGHVVVGRCPCSATKAVPWAMGRLGAGAGSTLSSSRCAPGGRLPAVILLWCAPQPWGREKPLKKGVFRPDAGDRRCERWEEKPAVPFPRVYSAEQQLQLDGNFSAGLTLKPNDNGQVSVVSVSPPLALGARLC